MRNRVALVALALACVAIGIKASDRVGVYAVVDKVVFEPSAGTPERIQVWGAFAVAKSSDRDYYEPVQRGYLYFALGEDKNLTRAEWNDLKSLAGTKRIAAFSARFGQSVRVRPQDEQPRAPDRYTLGVGVQTIQQNRDYAPVRELSAYLSR